MSVCRPWSLSSPRLQDVTPERHHAEGLTLPVDGAAQMSRELFQPRANLPLHSGQPPVDVFEAEPIVFSHGHGHGQTLPFDDQPRATGTTSPDASALISLIVAGSAPMSVAARSVVHAIRNRSTFDRAL
jgi:hypothetical protein